jgi:hypothetical protein
LTLHDLPGIQPVLTNNVGIAWNRQPPRMRNVAVALLRRVLILRGSLRYVPA